jgi:hypothetical protein
MKNLDHIAMYGIKSFERWRARIEILRKAHAIKYRAKAREYKKNNKAAISIQRKGYIKDHKEELAEYQKAYRETQNGKAAHRRGEAKRNRNLGFIALNSYFEDCEGHHITHNFVIYIPKTLHKSVWHNLNTGQGMKTINTLALDFLVSGFRNKNRMWL